jgi:predicted O-linked N-acetylglucosamine transferase (SPINDLY family)
MNSGFEHLLALYQQRRYVECEQAARLALLGDPEDGVAWKALGVALAAQGKSADALEAKKRAVELLPGDAQARANLANGLSDARRWGDAQEQFDKAIALDPRSIPSWRGLANVMSATGRFREAAQCLQRCAALQPASADALNEWGTALRVAQQMREARAAYERALAIDANHVEALTNLGNTLADLGEPSAAEERYRQALALQPARAAIHNNLGNLLKYVGRFAESLDCYREAMRLDPDFEPARTNFLLGLNHVPGAAPEEMKRHAQDYGSWATRRAGTLPRAARSSRGGRPLRVGWVSGDFRGHPVGYFLESTLAHWPTDRVELTAYTTFLEEDETTRRMRPRFSQWVPIANLSDRAAAARIAEDEIDLLVDLAGHTAHNRLGVFAWRPAPVQATWLGYFATTGVEQMDWILADAVSIRPGEEDRFTERVWRLPGTRMCFTPPAGAPDVSPLPADANGHVTFGSFQNLGKINDDVLALWSRGMAQVPGSRLRVQNVQLGEAESQRRFRERLARAGIDPSLASLHGKASRNAYLAAHAEVDLILDTFPYPGGTTTCEALWMGVPTVALAGDTMLARQGESLLEAAGLADWIARDADEYVRLATQGASAPEKLRMLRFGLRVEVAGSRLFDAPRFAHELARAFESMAFAA